MEREREGEREERERERERGKREKGRERGEERERVSYVYLLIIHSPLFIIIINGHFPLN